MKTQPRIFEIIGDKLKLKRLNANLTQDEIAIMAGLTRTSIINIESGRNGFSVESLMRFCHILGCQPNDLLPSTDEYQPKIKTMTDMLISKRDAEIKRLEDKIAGLKKKVISTMSAVILTLILTSCTKPSQTAIITTTPTAQITLGTHTATGTLYFSLQDGTVTTDAVTHIQVWQNHVLVADTIGKKLTFKLRKI